MLNILFSVLVVAGALVMCFVLIAALAALTRYPGEDID